MMSHFRRLLFIALFISILPFAHAEQPWVEVRSPHFTVITDAGDKRGREIARRFEQMRTAFGMIFTKVNVNAAPLEIVAFRNTRELRNVAPLYQGKPIPISGLFLADGRGEKNNPEDRQFITFDLSAEDNWTLVSHEYAHMLVNSNFPPTPPWFDEGFAEYCSSLRVGKKEIDLGLVPPDPPIILSGRPWLKLVDLFSVTRDSQIYNRDDRRSVFYAQSWLTVHYIMANRLLHEMSVYNHLVQRHVPVSDAIRRAFHMEPAQLERAVSNYYNSGQITYFKTAALPGRNDIAFNTRVLNNLELKTVMADLDFHNRDYESRGIAEFKEILAVQPDNPVANRSLGYVALDGDDWDKAGEYFKRASAQGSKDPQLHYLLALQMSRQEKAEGQSAGSESILKELQTAIALKPNYADAYELLGTILAFNLGQPEKGIESLKTAVSLNPRADWYVANLAKAYVRAEQPDVALPLFRQLQNSSVPHVAAMAGKQIMQIERYKSQSAGGQSQH
jgi:tetratricopeptide (TPR) repeat protein